jgi:hypothetical protein
MIEDGMYGSINISGHKALKLILVPSSASQLISFTKVLESISTSGGSRTLDNLDFGGSAQRPTKLQLKVSKPGQAEQLHLFPSDEKAELIVWEGDSEYWQECADKCTALLDAGRGHQYLLIRGSEDQECTLSYQE